ncbi:UDP-3-O-[3-hydroxymyristoyl] glucosamine N-acyltransferase [hydrothermal vent metagenome]|uniref:UDP-3-O-[3-hydroxymyristoyl] glucosamine N-acyltransferase n=1 Tax=hydrothermal vent metagenome TaxID=652676 RepID=A0A3B1AH65_9ZZZZ
MASTLEKLARHVNGKIFGDGNIIIDSVATLSNAKSGQISFLTNPKYRSFLTTTAASAVIVKEFNQDVEKLSQLVVDNPHAAYAKITQLLYPEKNPLKGIDKRASIHESSNVNETAFIGPNVVVEEGVEIGKGVCIRANCFIGRNVIIGENSLIYPNVTILDDVQIGQRCIIFPSAVIGGDGFGHAYDENGWVKIPQVGTVIIGNDVEVGASVTIDRGAIENTVIEDGVKLDNQIHIAHNVKIGANSILTAGATIAGSTTVGKNCMTGGMVGIGGHLEIADNVVVTGMSMVSKSIDQAGSYSSGIPVEPSRVWRRYVGRFKRLEGLFKRVTDCEKILKENKD